MNEPASNKSAEQTAAEGQTDEPVEALDPVEAAKARVWAQAETEAHLDGADPALAAEVFRERAAQLEAERDEMKDKMLRALADAENTRRRAIRDREEAEKYGGVRLARDLLAVYDNLDRALAAADETVRENAPDFIAGVELTKRELLNAFAKHQIAPVAPEVGEKFDPNRHQAMFEAAVPGAENGSVIQVMQQGFMISDRLLRAAMVGVAKAAAAAPAENPTSDESKPEADAATDASSTQA